MNKTKQIIGLLIALMVTVNGSSFYAYGMLTEDESFEYYSYAQKLSEIGVFLGTGSGFELHREPTRIEALVILIRLLGKEEEAKAMANQPSHFVDVPDWGRGYVNFAYQEGLTKGISDTEFGSYLIIQSRSFNTFILRALGYSDSDSDGDGDFSWNDANTKSFIVGLIELDLYTQLEDEPFLRNQVAKISFNALKTEMKVVNKSDIKASDLKTLGQHLVDLGDIDQTKAVSINIINEVVVEEETDDSTLGTRNPNDTNPTEVVKEPENEPSKETEENQEPIEIETKTSLLGAPTVDRQTLKVWAASKGMSQEGIDLVDIYYDISEPKGINPVIQYVQMCLETGWLYKNGTSQAGIDASWHNPCGLKTTEGGSPDDPLAHKKFNSWEEGIDAHTDHTALYAGLAGYPKADTLDPRHFTWLFGRGATVEDMGDSWVGNDLGLYAAHILKLYQSVLDM